MMPVPAVADKGEVAAPPAGSGPGQFQSDRMNGAGFLSNPFNSIEAKIELPGGKALVKSLYN